MIHVARNTLDDALAEAAALGETLALKLEAARRHRGGAAHARQQARKPHDAEAVLTRPTRAASLTPGRSPAALYSWHFLPQLGALFLGKRVALTAVAALVVAGGLPLEHARWRALVDLQVRTVAVPVRYADGSVRGVIAPAAPLTTLTADGSRVTRVTVPVEKIPADFMRLVTRIEGEGILGLDPVSLARASVCYAASESLGVADAEWLRLEDGRCAGASTLLAQAARTLRDDREYSLRRKFAEQLDAFALALFLGDKHDQFLVDTLRFGDSGGMPLIGLRAAALTRFGREPADLALHEQALLAAMLLRPARLHCGAAVQADIDRFDAQRDRARYALKKEYEHDPRLAQALAQLDAMPAITTPAPLAGMSGPAACRANAHPLRRLAQLDPSVYTAVLHERDALAAQGIHPTELLLSIDQNAQHGFLAAIEHNRVTMAAQGGWLVDPRSHDVAVLAFATRPDGRLRTLHESVGFEPQLFRQREIGSLGKLAGITFIAERGWQPNQPLCNLAWGGRHNAGGDAGFPSCASTGALMPIEQAFGNSVSLAVREGLSRFPQDELRSRMKQWGFTLPTASQPHFSISFGLAQASPARIATFAAAMSRGLAGQPAVAREPTLIARYRDAAGAWHEAPRGAEIDLRRAFATAERRATIARGAGAALTYRGPRGAGTLAALGAALPGEVAKSGTLDDESGRVRFKAAVGARAGAAWFAMAAPLRGSLGGNGVSVIPLAKTARQAAALGDAATN